jgi:hypothetical protein
MGKFFFERYVSQINKKFIHNEEEETIINKILLIGNIFED